MQFIWVVHPTANVFSGVFLPKTVKGSCYCSISAWLTGTLEYSCCKAKKLFPSSHSSQPVSLLGITIIFSFHFLENWHQEVISDTLPRERIYILALKIYVVSKCPFPKSCRKTTIICMRGLLPCLLQKAAANALTNSPWSKKLQIYTHTQSCSGKYFQKPFQHITFNGRSARKLQLWGLYYPLSMQQ